jgi:hypothetical protein
VSATTVRAFTSIKIVMLMMTMTILVVWTMMSTNMKIMMTITVAPFSSMQDRQFLMSGASGNAASGSLARVGVCLVPVDVHVLHDAFVSGGITTTKDCQHLL